MGTTRASLQSRLIFRLCAVFAAFFVVAGMVVFFIYHTDSEEIPFDVLVDDLHALRDAVTVDGGRVAVDETRLSPSIGYMVRTLDGTVKLSGGLHADELQAIETPAVDEVTESCRLAGKERPQRARPRNRQCSLSELIEVSGDTLVMQVTRRISPTSTALDALFYEWLGEYLPVTLPMLFVLIAALIVTLRSSMKPLERLMRYARAINPAQTGVRLPTDDLPKELLGAVEAVNGALDRLDRGFQVQREFLADAAHELRTPLAILAAHLDSMQDPARTAALRADVERMTTLVGQLLLVAQLEALTIRPDEQADLSEVASEVAILLAPLAVKAGRGVAVLNAEQPVVVRGNRDALYQAVRNLVENALKFTPPDTEVEIEVDRSGAVSVSDRGPGIPEDQRLLLFQRFWRADRRQTDGGAGLGLAITHRIAAAHGGQLLVDDNPGGGARFTLRVPKAG